MYGRAIDFSRNSSFEIEHFMNKGVMEWVRTPALLLLLTRRLTIK